MTKLNEISFEKLAPRPDMLPSLMASHYAVNGKDAVIKSFNSLTLKEPVESIIKNKQWLLAVTYNPEGVSSEWYRSPSGKSFIAVYGCYECEERKKESPCSKYDIITISGSRDECDEIIQFVEQNIIKEKTLDPGRIYYLAVDHSSAPTLNRAPRALNFPLIEENYSSSVVQKHKIVIENIALPNPKKGKIAVYQGPPGTGKTYLIRHIISTIKDCYIVLIQPHLVSGLADPELIDCLVDLSRDNLPIIFILEDADEILSSRNKKNISGISILLNFGDGILGSILDTRIICTTNAKIKEFDPAIMRPGRLLQFIEVGKLAPDEVLRAARRLMGEDADLSAFKKCETIAEVYAVAERLKNKND